MRLDIHKVVEITQNYLAVINNTNDCSNRTMLIKEMFNFIAENRDVALSNNVFRSSIEDKIFDFAIDENVRFEDEYLKIFNEELPRWLSNDYLLQ